MTPEEIEIRSKDATQLIGNPRFQEAFSNVREKIVASLESLPMQDKDYRDELVLSLQLLITLKRDIEEDIRSYQLEEFG